ncbi:BRO family protein [Anoxybacillus sp. FSL W8-1294]|uniref:BRO family protein n=1 Tax=Anoxybacillus sp. FSL W8-1294 TaxID=2954655 RepID=UPI0030CF8DB1
MNQLQQVFTYGETQIRTVVQSGEVLFVGKDVCDVLEIKNSRDALGRLDEDEKGVVLIDTPGGKQQMLCINEAGLYSLILTSRKPEAKQFKRWVTHEVLPTIRKTGGYVANEDMFINTYLPFADDQTKLMFRGVLETVRKQNEQIAAMKPKVEYFDALVDRNLLTNFRDTAKELQVKERFFIDWLLKNKFVYRDQKNKLKPYAAYVPELFELKEWERNGRADVQTLITPKGRETFRLLLKKERTA